MKRLVALAVAIAFAGSAGFAMAQTTAPAPAPAEKPADGSKAERAKELAAKKKIKNAQGVVKSASADSVVVSSKGRGKSKQESEWTFGVDSKTMIKKAGKSITAADIKEGDRVTVRFTEADGKMLAERITVSGRAERAEKKQ